jgi:hypothetical protein
MTDNFDDEILEDDESTPVIDHNTVKTSNAWRSIERHREIKELRKHVDDFLFEDAVEAALKELRW